MLLGRVESWEESTSPALRYGRVNNGQRGIYESGFSWLRIRSRSRKCLSVRFNRASREAKSIPPNFLPRRKTSVSSAPFLSMQWSRWSGSHQRLNAHPEGKQATKFALTLSTQVTSVWLCVPASPGWPSVTPLMPDQPSSLFARSRASGPRACRRAAAGCLKYSSS